MVCHGWSCLDKAIKRALHLPYGAHKQDPIDTLTPHFLRVVSYNTSIKKWYKAYSILYTKNYFGNRFKPIATVQKSDRFTPLAQNYFAAPHWHQSITSAKHVLQTQWVYKPWQHLISVSIAGHDERIKLLHLCIINSQHTWRHAFT